ncbi:MAG: hypothetical protein HAW62_01635 [Endozoicomonadaceae bacterium]|nr:hypothetical protein [Endozoicomonadaceae bacterium]
MPALSNHYISVLDSIFSLIDQKYIKDRYTHYLFSSNPNTGLHNMINPHLKIDTWTPVFCFIMKRCTALEAYALLFENQLYQTAILAYLEAQPDKIIPIINFFDSTSCIKILLSDRDIGHRLIYYVINAKELTYVYKDMMKLIENKFTSQEMFDFLLSSVSITANLTKNIGQTVAHELLRLEASTLSVHSLLYQLMHILDASYLFKLLSSNNGYHATIAIDLFNSNNTHKIEMVLDFLDYIEITASQKMHLLSETDRDNPSLLTVMLSKISVSNYPALIEFMNNAYE